MHNRPWVNGRLSVVTLLLGMALGAAAHADTLVGNADDGKAQAAACAACHGQDGATPIDPSYPNLAGQSEKYLLRQLEVIQSEERPVALMAGQLVGKSEQDLADLAAYYASLPAKVGQAQGDEEALAQAAKLYRGGMGGKGVAACSACHSPTGQGNAFAGFPSLSGQPAAYIVQQLTEYREGRRKTDEVYGGMMRGVAEGLTDTEILLLANYLQGLH